MVEATSSRVAGQEADVEILPATGGGPVAASPQRENVLGGLAESEAYVGSLDRRSLHKTPGLYTRAWRRFRKNRVAMTALVVLLLIFLFVLSAGLISQHVTHFTPSENHLGDKLKPVMTDGYILGSDGNGRDILTRLAYGGRVSIRIAILSGLATFFLGGAFGLLAGYSGGKIDSIIMRLVDVLLSIPGLPLLILIASLYAPGPEGLALVLAIVSWPSIARIVRGQVLELRGREFVDAARSLGASPVRIVMRHILPNILPLMIVYISLTIPGLILAETGLSFLGIGVQVPTPSWGNMLGDAQQFFRTNIAGVLIPGLMIYITSLSMNLVGNGLRDALDPKLTE
ncbi:MAG: ABC transporter permease [Chloroflexia bacterium]|nr:ABC transporter permease [Chloroflexia bacterium]